jgi:hypothetical protein
MRIQTNKILYWDLIQTVLLLDPCHGNRFAAHRQFLWLICWIFLIQESTDHTYRCVCVWHSIGSAPGRDTDLRPVSLEPAWPEPAILGKNFPEKWPVAKSRGKKFTTVMLFYGKNLAHFVFIFEKHFLSKC